MSRIWTTQLLAHIGQRVRLAGWLHHWRRLSRVSFLVVRDGRGLAQVVVEDPVLSRRLDDLHRESLLTIEGIVQANPHAPGGVEVHDAAIEVVVPTTSSPPLDLSRPALRASPSFVLDHAPVALRHPRLRARFEIASASMFGFRTTLRSLDFVEVQTPKIVSAATESGASVFSIDYFGRQAYLAQSPQLFKQVMVGVFERVFEIGPVFRAEPHDTPRHLNEYVSMDAEMGFIADHFTIMDMLTRVLGGMVQSVREEAATSLGVLDLSLPDVPATVPTLHFSEALELISRETRESVQDELDLAPVHERWLGRWAQATHGSDYLFVVGYPMATRPSIPIQTLRVRDTRTVSTCCFAGPSLSRAASACTVMRTMFPRCAPAGCPLSPWLGTSKLSSARCRRTVGLRSAWSAGWQASWVRPTSAKSPCSHATGSG
jgi:nondiscriminating aspartyl-tRNA synthetase